MQIYGEFPISANYYVLFFVQEIKHLHYIDNKNKLI